MANWERRPSVSSVSSFSSSASRTQRPNDFRPDFCEDFSQRLKAYFTWRKVAGLTLINDNYEGNLTVKKVQWHMKQADNHRLQKGWLTVDTERFGDNIIHEHSLDEKLSLEATISRLSHRGDHGDVQLLQKVSNDAEDGLRTTLVTPDEAWDRGVVSPRQCYFAAPEQPVVTIHHVKEAAYKSLLEDYHDNYQFPKQPLLKDYIKSFYQSDPPQLDQLLAAMFTYLTLTGELEGAKKNLKSFDTFSAVTYGLPPKDWEPMSFRQKQLFAEIAKYAMAVTYRQILLSEAGWTRCKQMHRGGHFVGFDIRERELFEFIYHYTIQAAILCLQHEFSSKWISYQVHRLFRCDTFNQVVDRTSASHEHLQASKLASDCGHGLPPVVRRLYLIGRQRSSPHRVVAAGRTKHRAVDNFIHLCSPLMRTLRPTNRDKAARFVSRSPRSTREEADEELEYALQAIRSEQIPWSLFSIDHPIGILGQPLSSFNPKTLQSMNPEEEFGEEFGKDKISSFLTSLHTTRPEKQPWRPGSYIYSQPESRTQRSSAVNSEDGSQKNEYAPFLPPIHPASYD